tara:strand:- start:2025 stop:2303 length:279 start_codon:yes stop_codon:yes gene_type:complete
MIKSKLEYIQSAWKQFWGEPQYRTRYYNHGRNQVQPSTEVTSKKIVPVAESDLLPQSQIVSIDNPEIPLNQSTVSILFDISKFYQENPFLFI